MFPRSFSLPLAGLVFLLAFTTTAAAQSTADCRVHDPELQGSYAGACRGGLAEGLGEARGTAQYRGELRAGRPHGKGVKTWPNGDRYEGEFVEGRKEGTGMYVWGPRSRWAGQRYTGGFANDKRHGYGVYEYPNSERYAGPWENDRFTGAPTKNMIARARAFAEHAAAVARVGVRVCRTLELGVGVPDTLRGTVTAVEGERITVRIDDPGKLDHTIGGQRVVKGALVSEDLKLWVPCL